MSLVVKSAADASITVEGGEGVLPLGLTCPGGEGLNDGRAALLAGVPNHHDGGDGRGGRRRFDEGLEADDAAALKEQNGDGIGFEDAIQETLLGIGEGEVAAVGTFLFQIGTQTADEDDEVGIARRLDALLGIIGGAGADGNAITEGLAKGGEDGGGFGGRAAVGTVLIGVGIRADDGDRVDAAEVQGEERFVETVALGRGIIF